MCVVFLEPVNTKRGLDNIFMLLITYRQENLIKVNTYLE